MASYNKFNAFTQDLVNAKHNFGTNTVKVLLTNTAPSATNAVKADVTEISAGNGYTAGGTTTTISISTSAGTAKVTASDIVFTASGGSIGPLRYAVVYNATTAANPLIAWFDYGSSITLNDTETLTVDFDNTNGLFTVT
jgi:hypothetical protein